MKGRSAIRIISNEILSRLFATGPSQLRQRRDESIPERLQRLLTVPHLLILVWGFLLVWGEHLTFHHSFNDCAWSKWEAWPSGARPHHVVLVADPQLVDPHTYPGRPWPLSTLTVLYTDRYIKHSFGLIQKRLQPNTVFFLGDLFDGGREWSTETSSSPEERWRRYGPKSWFNEYRRFSKIFVEPWIDNLKQKSPTFEESRKFIASLPGNHDIGLSRGIQLPVRNRFNAYFGDGNRVDIVANHTFVSVDTVSLSAWNSPELSEIWEPAMEFLDDASRLVDKRASSEVRRQYNNTRTDLLDQYVLNTTELQASAKTPSSPLKAEFPKILLSHVPLYRPPGTPCGPLREHWPPKSNVRNPDAVTTYDERNAIAVQAGYQYQNVLTDEVSHLLAKKIGDLEYVFSGDDHDYCDVIHQDYPSAGGGIRDITVKSISWAMGVRKPGFVMLSLWNPTDSDGKSTRKQDSARESRDTIQTHLCLLPDELGTFIRYAIMLASTLCILIAANASTVIYHTRGRQAYKRTGSSMGPESAHSSQSHESLIDRSGYLSSGEGRGASVSSSENSLRFAQETIARSRSVECAEHAFAADGYRRQPSMDPEKGMTKARHRKPSPLVAELAVPKSSLSLFYAQTARDIIRVGVVVGTFYLWLLWHMG